MSTMEWILDAKYLLFVLNISKISKMWKTHLKYPWLHKVAAWYRANFGGDRTERPHRVSIFGGEGASDTKVKQTTYANLALK